MDTTSPLRHPTGLTPTGPAPTGRAADAPAPEPAPVRGPRGPRRTPGRRPDTPVPAPDGRGGASGIADRNGAPTFVRVSAALQAGATRAELRRSAWVAPLYGLRCAADEYDPTSLPDRCRAVLAVAPPGTVISHETAAALHGLWLPRRMTGSSRDVHVTCPDPKRRVRRPGVAAHAGLTSRATTSVRGDLPVVTAADAWADLAGALDLNGLVVVGDSVAARAGGMGALRTVVERRAAAKARHVRVLRDALSRVRERSRSPQESLARLMFVAAGLPEPLLNQTLHDEGGNWLGELDFVWPHARVFGEYQGDQHRERRQAVIDSDKRRGLEAAGWRGFDLWSDHLSKGPKARELVQHVASLLGVPYDPDRVIPLAREWNA